MNSRWQVCPAIRPSSGDCTVPATELNRAWWCHKVAAAIVIIPTAKIYAKTPNTFVFRGVIYASGCVSGLLCVLKDKEIQE
jgi:hypothetical protein